mgnify:CR=1 FL=1
MAVQDELLLTCRAVVHQHQCDFMGHMNVSHYVSRFDEATWQLVGRLGLTRDYCLERGVGMAAVQQNISYLRELRAGDIFTIYSGVHEVRQRLLHFEHLLLRDDDDETAARCDMRIVHMDATGRRATPLPAFVAGRAEALMWPASLAD